MDAVVSEAGSGRRWEMEPGRTATFRVLSVETGGATAVFEEAVPPGAGTPLHIHHPSDELILVRSGLFTFRIGEELRSVESGGWVFIPRGLVHGWRNTGTVSGDLSFVFVPAAGAVCFEELRTHERMIPDIPEAELVATFTKHGYELVSFEW
jgi:quercetin dioxygenase-like cupin family protein